MRASFSGLIASIGIASLSVSGSNFEVMTKEIIYATGFEAEEGFDLGFELIEQNGWEGAGYRSNGLFENAFEGEGQQAFIGLDPPESEDPDEVIEFFDLYRFVDVSEFPEGSSLIRFQVTMEIVDSTNRVRDNFAWSIFNVEEDHLFSLEFDNETKEIMYLLDDEKGLMPTGFVFENLAIYDLEIIMDFPKNLWCARIGESIIVDSQPLTTQNSQRSLGDISAFWAIFNPQNPGDNYMIFDNYSIERVGLPALPARVEAQGILSGSGFVLRVFGEADTDYRIEATSNFKQWTPIRSGKTSAEDGTFDFIDEDAKGITARFYRAITLR